MRKVLLPLFFFGLLAVGRAQWILTITNDIHDFATMASNSAASMGIVRTNSGGQLWVGTLYVTQFVNQFWILTNTPGGWACTSLALGTTPNLAAPNGFILTTTGGVFYVRTNGVWLQK
jgi:hypothetical protein